MTAPIHWKIREYVRELRDDGRFTVLMILWSHSNIRLRCWPGVDTIAAEAGWALPSVIKAKKWLLAHDAIVLVPYNKRVNDELKLPRRQHVYQLTGMIRLDDGMKQPYLMLTPEAEAAISAVIDNAQLSETSLSETSLSEAKGITSIEGNTKDKVLPSAPSSPPKARNASRLKVKRSVVEDKSGEGEIQIAEETTKRKQSELELILQRAARGRRLSKECVRQLNRPLSTYHGDLPSPIVLYDSDPYFRGWVIGVVGPEVRSKGHSTDAQFLHHLVNKICYRDLGQFKGYLRYKADLEAERAQEEALAQAKANEYHEIDHVQGVPRRQESDAPDEEIDIQALIDDLED